MDYRSPYGPPTLWLLFSWGIIIGAGCDGDSLAADSGSADGAMPPADSATDTRSDAPDTEIDAAIAADGGEECRGTFVTEVQGTIVTEGGEGVPGARPQACIRKSPDRALTCLEPPTADAAGSWFITVPDAVQCWESAAMRVLLPAGGYATTYCDLDPSPAADGVLGVSAPYVLYATPAPSTLPPVGDASVMRTVVFDDGLEVDVVPDSLGFGVDYDSLAARRVPLGAESPCFAEGAGLAGLYGFGEEGSADDGGVAVRIPNTTAIAAGAAVELLLVGGLATTLGDGTPVEEAALVVFGTATVSADGAFVVSDPGSELPYFTWLGYRAAP